MKSKLITIILAGLAIIIPMTFFELYAFLMFLDEQVLNSFPLTILCLLIRISAISAMFGIYVVILKRLPHWLRRTIAYFHTGCGLILLGLYLHIVPSISEKIAMQTLAFRIESGYIYFYQWFFLFTGLAFGMTYHGRIKELCPLQKTRMGLLLSFPLVAMLIGLTKKWGFVGAIGMTSLLNYGPTILSGLLYGIYVWVLERLTEKNKKTVLIIQSLIGIGLMLFIFVTFATKNRFVENVSFLSEFQQWGIFSLILLIFDVKFISNSQTNDNINM